ncbi:MAG: LysM peptidoglycan-binding domain-containing protein [Betaproteobacteria bacterium]|nr:MAG: LysM peptidoglycan-binding domain-containing protein [Betaproteobacteria bacterium]
MSEKLSRLLAATAMCTLAAACSQIPWDPDPGPASSEKTSPAAESAVSAPVAQPAADAGIARARVAAPAEVPAARPAAAAPASVVPVPPVAMPQDAKEIEPPHAIDLARPADDLWDRIRNGFAMSDLESPLVGVRERWYASQPEYLKRMIERSKLYLYYIVEEVEKRGMPTEIALLPMVESAFNPMAYSRSHASGLWQFIPSTGKTFKLSQNWWADSRRDVVASTSAALDYLQALYELHGDWHLALASYNYGENGVARAIERNRAKGLPTDYLSLKMPPETRGYVPKLQALKNMISNPEAFGVSFEPIPNEPYFVTVPTPSAIDIRLAATFAEMSADELIALNPALNRPMISGPHTQTLVLPADRVDAFQRNLDAYDQPLTSWQPYTMKGGDSLERLAAKHGIALSKLKLANGITSRTRVGPGFQLLLPLKGSGVGAQPLPAVFRPPVQSAPRRGGLVHIVRKGETLYGISRRYRVSTDSLLRWNHVGVLTTGQRLIIYRAPAKARKPVTPVKISASQPEQNRVASLVPAGQQ